MLSCRYVLMTMLADTPTTRFSPSKDRTVDGLEQRRVSLGELLLYQMLLNSLLHRFWNLAATVQNMKVNHATGAFGRHAQRRWGLQSSSSNRPAYPKLSTPDGVSPMTGTLSFPRFLGSLN